MPTPAGQKSGRRDATREPKEQRDRAQAVERATRERTLAIPLEAAPPYRAPRWLETHRALIVPDGAQPNQGQLERSVFLELVHREIIKAAGGALEPEWSADGCPYIERWFEEHRESDAETLERYALRYARFSEPPSSAEDYLAPITERLAASIRRWRANEDVSRELHEAGMIEDDVRDRALAGLGLGRPLAGERASQIAGAFGLDTSTLRIHDDSAAHARASDLGAHAFTVGAHVAFAAGEFAPGTLRGDAILAHELAHVAQQRGAKTFAPSAAPAAESDAGDEHPDDRQHPDPGVRDGPRELFISLRSHSAGDRTECPVRRKSHPHGDAEPRRRLPAPFLRYIIDRAGMTTSFPHRAAILGPLVTPPPPPPQPNPNPAPRP